MSSQASEGSKRVPAGENQPGPLAQQPANGAPPEAPVHPGSAKEAETEIKPSAPGETGTTPGTNWKQ